MKLFEDFMNKKPYGVVSVPLIVDSALSQLKLDKMF